MNAPLLRVPPHSQDAERAVLGGLLIDSDRLPEVADLISTEDFYHSDHRRIFEAISAIDGQSNPVDIVTVAEWLESKGDLESIGGVAFLDALIDRTPTAVNVASYAGIVRDKATLRRYVAASYELADAAFKGDLDAMSKFMAQALPESRQTRRTLRAAITEAVEYIDEAFQGKAPGIPTGIERYDELYGGLHPGQLIIVAGRPSMGKTAVMMNLAHSAINAGVGVSINTLEMSEREIVFRLFSIAGNLPMWRMLRGSLEDLHWPQLTNAVCWMTDKPLRIHENYTTIGDICNAAVRDKRENDSGLLVVDYLQLVQGEGNNRSEQLGDVTRRLKRLAKRLNMAVVLGSQLNRDLEKRKDKHPVLSDLRESGEIEQDADAVLMLYRDEIYNPNTGSPNILEICVEKYRNGPVGKVEQYWHGETMRILNLSSQERWQ